MKQRTLGRSGLQVSEIAFGCGTSARLMIDGAASERRVAVADALACGINFFDTAPLYGNARSEANLGATLAELKARPVIATKVILGLQDFDDIAGTVQRSVRASLDRLRVTHLPLVHLHNRVAMQRAPKGDVGSAPLLSVHDVLGRGGVLEALQALRAEGLVQHFGCCAFGGDMAALRQVIDSGAFTALLVSYSLINPSVLHPLPAGSELRDYQQIGAYAAARGLGLLALRVLEAGKLTTSPPSLPANAQGETRAAALRGQHLRARMEAIGLDCAQTAIRFALSDERISSLLMGVSERAHVEAAARASESGPLDTATLATLLAESA